ncbi:putative ABC transport system permease protein [Desulfonatronum thiosulfatophilum]|uniref:Putative ABC transport system permease protein n=1 Tax=Desulfonatronum thiosulfatophilum TaxID=617002 RepID=A0A1G6C1H5_9BACT|nr:ABC transporter permease [Desulfonatronum thiosulfatophilum]SDB26695.1 putative ABC transport system permease protein [Desulfonatronum thiosulfatophilum]
MTISKLVVRNIVWRRGRFVFTLLGITIGIASYVTFLSMGGSLKNEIHRETAALGANLIVIPKGSCGYEQLSILTGDQMPTNITSEEVVRIESIEGLTVIPFLVQRTALNNVPITVNGILPDEVMHSRGLAVDQGRYFSSPEDTGAVIGSEVAARFGFPPGSTLTLRGAQVPVLGVLKATGGKDDVTIFLPMKLAQDIFNSVNLYSYVAIAFNDPALAESYSDQIRAATGLGVVSDQQMLSSVLAIVGSVNVTLQLIAAVAILAAAFGIINTMMTATYERKREIGILQALGATRKVIFSVFVMESGLYGLFGGICGVAGGMLASVIVTPYISENAFTTLMKGSGSGNVFDVTVILGAMTLSILVAVIAGVYPAWRAARLSPVEAISHG